MFKVILVDDEEQIRKGLHTIIPWESFGFVVAGEASDGKEAVEVAESVKPDLVITDIKMPKMDGIELAREIGVRYPEVPVLILSGYNEFTYAKEALKYGVADYLLKPVDPDELSRALGAVYEKLIERTRRELKEKRQAKSLRNLFLGKLVRGEIHGTGFRDANEHDLRLGHGRFCVLIASLDRYGDMVLSRTEQEIGLIKFSLENIIEELLGTDGYLFELNDQQFGVLLAGSGLEQENSRMRIAERIAANAERFAKERLTVAAGTVVDSPERIRESYDKALKALDRKFYYEGDCVFLYRTDDFDEGQAGGEWDDLELLQAVQIADPDRIRTEVDRIFADPNLKKAPLDSLQYRTMMLIIRLAKLTEENKGDWDSFYSGKFRQLEHIFRYGDLQRLKAFLDRIAVEIGSHLEAQRSRKTENRIREIVEHVEAHYNTDLNLKQLSRMFYINAVYLGQLFKKETGEFFNDYINRLRIAEACRLLERTDLSAADIAERVGYKYVDHFYRHFKQLHGMSPGEYRQHP